MKKVLFCLKMPHNTYVGGVATVINQYLEHRNLFEKNGYSVEVFDYVLPSVFKKLPSQCREFLYGFLQKRALKHYLKNNEVEIVNIHTSREWLFLKDLVLAKAVSRKYGTKVVLTVHVGAASTVFKRIERFKEYVVKALNFEVSKTVFLSKQIQGEFIALGVDAERTAVLYNSHNLTPVNLGSDLKRNAALQLLYVGALHREKGILELLEALCALTDVNFHIDICGLHTDQSIVPAFNRYIELLGNKVSLRGYVSGSEKTMLFAHADVLLLPSYHEGMPLVILEALASGCAIISTKVGTTPEILTDQNVRWVNKQSSEEIKAAVKVLSQDAQLLHKLQNNNLALSQNYTMQSHIQRLCRIYANVD